MKARVLDLLSQGLMRLNIRGTLLTARTDLLLSKDAVLNLRVTGADPQSGEVRLQFLGAEEGTAAGRGQGSAASAPDIARTMRALRGLAYVLSRISGQPLPEAQTSSGPHDKVRASISYEQARTLRNAVADLVKALPDDASELPLELRVTVRDSLARGLRALGPSIPARHADFAELLRAPELSGRLDPNRFADQSVPDEGGSLLSGLKQALSDTGVALEAKMRTLAHMPDGDAPPGMEEGGQRGALAEEGYAGGRSAVAPKAGVVLENDLKAQLLSVREQLGHQNAAASSGVQGKHEAGALAVVERQLAGIETFQALSKLNESFHTFLPFQWQELRDGDIAFKRQHADTGDVHYCLVNLDLEEVGKAKIMIAAREKKVSVDILISNPVFKSLVETHLNEIGRGMRSHGLMLERLTVSQSSGDESGDDDVMRGMPGVSLKV